jgi:hypothetical protein
MRSRVCSFQFLLGIASAAFLKPESHGTHEHILLSLFLDHPNLESPVAVFISPRNRVAQLHPLALGYPPHSNKTGTCFIVAYARFLGSHSVEQDWVRSKGDFLVCCI